MNAKVKEVMTDQKIDGAKIGADLFGLAVGGCAAFAVEKVMDNFIPVTGNVIMDTVLSVGKWSISGLIGGKVADDTSEMITVSIDLSKSLVDQFMTEDDGNVQEVYVTVEEA